MLLEKCPHTSSAAIHQQQVLLRARGIPAPVNGQNAVLAWWGLTLVGVEVTQVPEKLVLVVLQELSDLLRLVRVGHKDLWSCTAKMR